LKVCSISRIKNEADIIETFVRYHLNFIDEMIIFEDNSSDDTYEILSKLKKENLPIHVFRNTKEHSEQQNVINIAFNKAIYDYGADLVVTLDTDEFLVSSTGGNPREILESLDDDKYYKVHWRTYLPNLDSGRFSLDDLITIRDPRIDSSLFKSIIPRNLCKKYDFLIGKGNHYLTGKENIPFEVSKKLRIAHIPIRSKEQCISKETIGWLYDVSSYYKPPIHSWHQNEMFQLIKKSNGQLSDEDIINYVKSYSSVIDEIDEIKVVKKPFDTEFCKNMELKYTQNESFNVVNNILDFCENMALEYGKLHQTIKNMNEDILSNTDADESYITILEESYTQVKKQLYFTENEGITKEIDYRRMVNHRNNKINQLTRENKVCQDNLKKLTEEKNQLHDVTIKKDKEIKTLNDEISKIKASKDKEVKLLNDEISKVKALKDKEVKAIVNQKDKEITVALDEKKFMKKMLDEKNNQLEVLEEKIRILNSIIDEKEKTIDSFRMGKH